MPVEVKIPLLNPNEPEALLAGLHVSEGQHVSAGDALCSLETTKSNLDVLAEVEGFVAGLRFSQGESARAGETLCWLADSPGWSPPSSQAPAVQGSDQGEVPDGLRITRPALELARQRQLDLSQLPLGPLVTESAVRQMLQKPAGQDFAAPQAVFDPTGVIIYGGGGHGKMVIDLLRGLGVYRIAGVIDDGVPAGTPILDVPVLGNQNELPRQYEKGVRLAINAVGGIGNIAIRIKIFRRLAEAGFAFPAIAHSTCCVEPSAYLSPGSQVFAHAYVGSSARVGFGVIVNTGAIVSHDCILSDYVSISPGAMLAGEVQAGPGALVGMGATVNLGVKIGQGARIGNSATVKTDVPDGGIVRAGAIWPE